MVTAQRRGRRGGVARVAIWLVLPATAVLSLGRIYLSILNGETSGAAGVAVNVLLELVGLGFVALGLLVVHRRPANPVGWIIAGAGVTVVTADLLQSYGIYSLFTEPGRFPGGEMAAWLSTLMYVPVLFAAPAMLFLFFPDGKLMGRPWRVVFWLVILTTCVAIVSGALDPVQDDAPFKGVVNPFGPDPPRALTTTLSFIGWPGIAASFLLAGVAMIVRLRRSRGVERQQLKWIAAAAAVLPLASAGGVVSYYLGYETFGVLLATFSFLPVFFAAGYAVLRHRLYDIDVVINRTLVYGSLTATLVVAYFGVIVVLQRTFVVLTGEKSTLAVVASTLLIAALFNPLRHRFQAFIDRLFYRKKYDAAKTLEAYSLRLREETDLDTLGSGLVSLVRETMQPSHVSLWLRSPEGER